MRICKNIQDMAKVSRYFALGPQYLLLIVLHLIYTCMEEPVSRFIKRKQISFRFANWYMDITCNYTRVGIPGPSMDHRIPIDGPPTFLLRPIDGPLLFLLGYKKHLSKGLLSKKIGNK